MVRFVGSPPSLDEPSAPSIEFYKGHIIWPVPKSDNYHLPADIEKTTFSIKVAIFAPPMAGLINQLELSPSHSRAIVELPLSGLGDKVR